MFKSWGNRRNVGSFIAITKNRIAGRTFVPDTRKSIFIETSARCNLACRFCIYDNESAGDFMDHASFLRAVYEATSVGFRIFYITPMIGEVFADPGVFEKFDALEANPKVEGFSFYSNFILPRLRAVSSLGSYKKITDLFISIYGFDEASFVMTTRKPAIQFRKLEANLKKLFNVTANGSMKIHFNVRTVVTPKPYSELGTPLTELLNQFVTKRGANLSEATEYDNWVGRIDKENVEQLGIDLTDGRYIYKYGACTKFFNEIKIKVNGKVSACAPRDVDGSLTIGDLADSSLKDILSKRNPIYKKLIDDQMQGGFNELCSSCAIYRSIYDHRPSQGDQNLKVANFVDEMKVLS